jgi:hypothetical protein
VRCVHARATTGGDLDTRTRDASTIDGARREFEFDARGGDGDVIGGVWDRRARTR